MAAQFIGRCLQPHIQAAASRTHRSCKYAALLHGTHAPTLPFGPALLQRPPHVTLRTASGLKHCRYLQSFRTAAHRPSLTLVNGTVPRLIPTIGFHTSPKKNAPPIAVLLAVKSLAKAAAVLTGRTLRNHWQSHPKHKHKTMGERLRENRGILGGGLALLLGLGIGFYYYHIEYTPLTNRPRFILFNKTQFDKIVETEYQTYCKMYEDSFVPVTRQIYPILAQVVKQLVDGNQDVPQIRRQTWTIHVVDKDIGNAFVLPNGHIFVFTGLLQSTENVQQLATLLAHEMAHVVLNHSAEQASFFEFFDLLMIAVLTALWAFLPNDGIALVATWFKSKVVELLLHMPYSRNLEIEADEVGLMLAAKSCFDVRECKAFWEAMDATQLETGEPAPTEFLSTHPSHQRRAEYIGAILPRALRVREYCNCPALPPQLRSAKATIRGTNQPQAESAVAAA